VGSIPVEKEQVAVARSDRCRTAQAAIGSLICQVLLTAVEKCKKAEPHAEDLVFLMNRALVSLISPSKSWLIVHILFIIGPMEAAAVARRSASPEIPQAII